MATRKVVHQGREILGTDVDFKITSDGSVTIELDDGAVLRLRQIVVNVVKTEERLPDTGERVYLVNTLNQVLLVKPAKEDES